MTHVRGTPAVLDVFENAAVSAVASVSNFSAVERPMTPVSWATASYTVVSWASSVTVAIWPKTPAVADGAVSAKTALESPVPSV